MKKNSIIIISGPSGAGEDSIIEGLSKRLPIERVVTTTSRKPRMNETEGHPYYFLSKDNFEKGIKEGKFLEYAEEYNGNYYGVTFEEIERVKNSNKIGIWKIEYKGVMTAKKLMPEILSIFVTAPLDILEKRIRRRSSVTDDYVAERMAYTQEWLKHKDIYDYEVENEEGKLIQTIDKVEAIVHSHVRLDKK